MAAITAALVKDLRDRTSAGMMDCKKALEANEGDVEKAIDWLRQKGLSNAAKKAGRDTTEGLVALKNNDNNSKAAIVEIMCETDFVARGDDFKNFTADIAGRVFDKNPADDAALQALVGDDLKQLIGKLGENMSVGRFCCMEVAGNGVVGAYIHSNGKIGVLVEVSCQKTETAANPALFDLAKNIAMQVAASNPASLDEDSIDPAIVERRIKKFYQEVCLVNQAYIRDDKLTIKDLVANTGKELDDSLKVVRYFRIGLGEGAATEAEA